jgi:arginyl-tRNA synthetase
MSKRTGNAITIRELCEDVGVDAARYFFVSKEVGTHMDFDMNLARERSNDNPVYYAQYAYYANHGSFTEDLAALGCDLPAYPVTAEVTRHGFELYCPSAQVQGSVVLRSDGFACVIEE